MMETSTKPMVKTSDLFCVEWDQENIINQILKDTQLCKEFYNTEPASIELATDVAQCIEDKIIKMGLKTINSSMVRELVCAEFMERGMIEYRNTCARIGASLRDAYQIDNNNGFEARDNANLQTNPETIHKKKADKFSKEQYLMEMPIHLTEAHLRGDIHIHDLEYFGNRPFCMTEDTVLCIYDKFKGTTLLNDAKSLFGNLKYAKSMGGDFEIADVENLDIYACSKNGIFKQIKYVTRRETREQIYTVRTTTGKSIRLTGDHRVILDDGTERMVERRVVELKPKDRLYTFKNRINWKMEHTYVKTPLFDTKINDITISDNLLTLIGYYTSFKMNWGKPLYGSRMLPIVSKILPDYLKQKSEKMLYMNCKTTYNRIKVEEFLEHMGVSYISKYFCHIIITDERIHDIFEKLGVDGEHIPEWILSGNNIRHNCIKFVSGLDQDVVISKNNNRIDIVLPETLQTSSEIQKLQFMFTILDIKTRYVKNRPECLVISGYSELEKICDIFKYTHMNMLFNKDDIHNLIEYIGETCKHRSYTVGDDNIVDMVYYDNDGGATKTVYDLSLVDTGEGEFDHVFYAGSGILIHNCQDHDLRYLFYYGFMPDGKGSSASVSAPAKRPEVAVLHAVKLLAAAQTNFAGGQGYYNFLTFLSPYFEGLSYESIYQYMQMFVYEMTQMMVARGGQTVFSSIQLSPGVPSLWWDVPVVYKGKVWNGENNTERITYGKFEREVRLTFKALMEVMLGGDYWGKPFNFPKPEISIEPDFLNLSNTITEWNKNNPDIPTYEDLYKLSTELTIKYGTPYFDNQIPAYRGAGNGISCYQCCLTEDTTVPVESKNGVKFIKIKELTEEDRLLTPTGYEKFEGIYKKDVENETLTRITLYGGRRIECTNDHKLPVVDNNTGEYTLETVETIKNKFNESDKLIYLPSMLDMFEEDISIVPLTRRYRPDEDKDQYITDLCKLLGIFTVKGKMHGMKNKRVNTRYLYLLFREDEEELIEETKNLIRRLFKEDWSFGIKKTQKHIEIKFTRDVCRWFKKNMLHMIPLNEHVPDFIFNLPKKYRLVYLNSVFNCRGSYTQKRDYARDNGKLEISSLSIEFIDGVLCLMRDVGFSPVYVTYSDPRNQSIHPRHCARLNRQQDIAALIDGELPEDVPYNDEMYYTHIYKIEDITYTGTVYDPINVENGHVFYLGNGVLSSNCAYSFGASPESDSGFFDKIHFKDGKHFSMGSAQVVTLNCPRAAYESGSDINKLVENLRYKMDLAVDVFKLKRKMIDNCIKNGLIPFAMQRPRDPQSRNKIGEQLVDINSLVYTIGILGFNEMIQHITGKQLYESKDSLKKCIYVLAEMNKYAKKLSEEYGIEIAVARTPAETTCQRFAISDILNDNYSDIAVNYIKGDIKEGIRLKNTTRDLPIYYTNGTHIPVDAEIGLFDKIKLEQVFFPMMKGGNICHIFIGESMPNVEGTWKFIKNIVQNTQIGYFAITRDMTISMNQFHKL